MVDSDVVSDCITEALLLRFVYSSPLSIRLLSCAISLNIRATSLATGSRSFFAFSAASSGGNRYSFGALANQDVREIGLHRLFDF